MRGHLAKTGPQPKQFGLAMSSCTISHQSTFSTLSDLPSIHIPFVHCWGTKHRERKRETEGKNKKIHIHTSAEGTELLCLKFYGTGIKTDFVILNLDTQGALISVSEPKKHAACLYQDLTMLVIVCLILRIVETCSEAKTFISVFFTASIYELK